jgi:hypothetical protein
LCDLLSLADLADREVGVSGCGTVGVDRAFSTKTLV